MPETYDVILAAVRESNWTASTTVLPSVTVITKQNSKTTINGRTTSQLDDSKKGRRPRVSRYVRISLFT